MRKFASFAVASAMAVGAVFIAAPSAGAASAAATKKFCDLNFQISITFNSLPDGEPTAKQLKALSKKLNPLLTAAQKVAPSEIADDVDTAVDALKADPSALFTDDSVGQAGAAIDEWATDNCDYQSVDVTAKEYSFSGVPSSLDTGKTVVQFTNNGAEPHVFVVVRNKGKMSTEDILALPEEKALKQVEEIGSAFAAPGESGTGYLDITKPGKYIALCPISDGTTLTTEGTGPPHFTHGMVVEFTVS